MSEQYRVVQGFRDDDVRWSVYRGDRPVETFAARAVAEECARALNADLEAVEANRARDAAADVALADALADAPTDEPAFEPTPEDRSEAGQLFGDLENDLDVAEFTAWIEGLHHERFRQVSQAIDVLRGALAEYRGAADVRDVTDWID
ncbi:MAG: hypothetical protein JO284_18630 [Planctomycetaceae bacterium]|nr:hypothetical protein [Planctomycetaceae bacterium]MBV8315967.1 hypothetical protein [Planctomycetaceae bacterium]